MRNVRALLLSVKQLCSCPSDGNHRQLPPFLALLLDLPVQILGLAKYRESSTIQQHCNLNLHCIQVCVTVTRFYISESVVQDTASSVQISSTQSQIRIARLQSEFVCWLQTQRWLKGML